MVDNSMLGYKVVSDMLIDEIAYVSPHALTYNKQKQRYLLTIIPITDKPTKEMCLPVYRCGPNPADFDVDISGIEFPWKLEKIPFKDYPGDRECIVCIDNIVEGISADAEHNGKQQ